MKRRTLQACSFKHSIKKGMFFCLGQIDLYDAGNKDSCFKDSLKKKNCAATFWNTFLQGYWRKATFKLKISRKAKMAASEKKNVKLENAEKSELISFYK